MPVYALAYGTWEVLLPGWVLALASRRRFPGAAVDVLPAVDYLRQRRLQVLDPVVASW